VPSEVARCLRTYAYKTGEFVLASGQKSNEYVNVRNAILHPAAQPTLIEAILDCLDLSDDGPDAIAGVAVGAIPLAVLAADRIRRCRARPCFTLVVRKEDKKHGTGDAVDGLDNVRGYTRPGSGFTDVILLEDVVTTGESTLKAMAKLRENMLRVTDVIVVVDREQGGLGVVRTSHPLVNVRALTTLRDIREAEPLRLK
jgi:orotate phosphoribosyltransferase